MKVVTSTLLISGVKLEKFMDGIEFVILKFLTLFCMRFITQITLFT